MYGNEQKRVMIVGATSGLGRLLAERYIAEGHTVCIVGRRENLLDEVAGGHPSVHRMVADVTEVSDVIPRLARLVDDMGGMDLLVLCAGVGRMNPDLDYGLELPTIDTNVRGWTAVADWAFAFFMRQGYGQLAAISSVAGVRGLAPAPAYAASKAYQTHYLDALRQRARMDHSRVTVTDVRPGFARTSLLAHPERLFWVEEPEKVARAIFRTIEAKKNRAVVTRRWAFMYFLMRIAPESLFVKILGKA
ncbi:MAG: SDR family NAD(P)-dependent oxidoreductase [Paraprevotella sp.]|nr:SDR family NAD(P)-dependent oxidoreductase [Paraprevotella sp.]